MRQRALATAGSAQAATDCFLTVSPAAGTNEPIVVELTARKSGGAGSVTPMRTLFQLVFITKREQSGIAQASVSPKRPVKPDTFSSWSVITNTPINVLAAPYRA